MCDIHNDISWLSMHSTAGSFDMTTTTKNLSDCADIYRIVRTHTYFEVTIFFLIKKNGTFNALCYTKLINDTIKITAVNSVKIKISFTDNRKDYFSM